MKVKLYQSVIIPAWVFLLAIPAMKSLKEKIFTTWIHSGVQSIYKIIHY